MKKLFLTGIFILITLFSFSAEVIRYVDPDASGGGTGVDWTNAYTSLNAWEAAEQTNLVSAGDWHHCYVRASSGTDDTTTIDIEGWTLNSTHYILIEAASTDYATKDAWDGSKYVLESRMRIRQGWVIIDGLQFGAQPFANILGIENPGVGRIITIKNCRFNNTDGSSEDIEITASNGTVNIWNCVLAERGGTADYGIQILGAGEVNIWNCLIEDRSTGVLISSGGTDATIINCTIFNNADDINDSASSTIDHCASDDGDGTNPVAPSGAAWTNEYTAPATGDFTLLNTGNCYHGGADNPSSGLYATDMEGDTYNSGAYSIGVDEYVAAGGISIPVVMNHLRNMGISIVFSMYTVLSIILYRKYIYYKRQLLFYDDSDNINAMVEVNRFLEEYKHD